MNAPYDPMSDPTFWKYYDLFSQAQAGTSTENQQLNIMALVNALSTPSTFNENMNTNSFGIPAATQSMLNKPANSENENSLSSSLSWIGSNFGRMSKQASDKITNHNPLLSVDNAPNQLLKNSPNDLLSIFAGVDKTKAPEREKEKENLVMNKLFSSVSAAKDKQPVSSNTLFRAAFSYPAMAKDNTIPDHSNLGIIEGSSAMDSQTVNTKSSSQKDSTLSLDSLVSGTPRTPDNIKFMTLNTETDQLPIPPFSNPFTKSILSPPGPESMTPFNRGTGNSKRMDRKELIDKITSLLSNRQTSIRKGSSINSPVTTGSIAKVDDTVTGSRLAPNIGKSIPPPPGGLKASTSSTGSTDMGNVIPSKGFAERLKILHSLYGDMSSIMTNPMAMSYLLKSNPSQTDIMSLMSMSGSNEEGPSQNPLLLQHLMQQGAPSAAHNLPLRVPKSLSASSNAQVMTQSPQQPNQNGNLLTMLALSGSLEGLNPVMLYHLLSQQGDTKQTNILPLLALSGGGENLNPLLLQSVLSTPGQSGGNSGLLPIIALTGGADSPLMENPAMLISMMNSGIGRTHGYNSGRMGDEQDGNRRYNQRQQMSSSLPMLLMGNEAMSENPMLRMTMLNNLGWHPGYRRSY